MHWYATQKDWLMASACNSKHKINYVQFYLNNFAQLLLGKGANSAINFSLFKSDLMHIILPVLEVYTSNQINPI